MGQIFSEGLLEWHNVIAFVPLVSSLPPLSSHVSFFDCSYKDFPSSTIAFVRFGSVWWFEMAQGFVMLIFFVFPPNDFSFHLFGFLGEPPSPSHFIVSIRKLTVGILPFSICSAPGIFSALLA
ncbi:hypothetical protein Bca4012_050007 [Brassica carinata]